MKILKKFIQQAIAEDAPLPEKGEYGVNFYKAKKDNGFLSYIARKNPFAYYLLQTNMPNEIIKSDPLYVRIGRLLTGSKTRKIDPRTGTLYNDDYGAGRLVNRANIADYPQLNADLKMENIRKELNRMHRL